MWTTEAQDQTTKQRGSRKIPTRMLLGPTTPLYISEFNSFQRGLFTDTAAIMDITVIRPSLLYMYTWKCTCKNMYKYFAKLNGLRNSAERRLQVTFCSRGIWLRLVLGSGESCLTLPFMYRGEHHEEMSAKYHWLESLPVDRWRDLTPPGKCCGKIWLLAEFFQRQDLPNWCLYSYLRN